MISKNTRRRFDTSLSFYYIAILCSFELIKIINIRPNARMSQNLKIYNTNIPQCDRDSIPCLLNKKEARIAHKMC